MLGLTFEQERVEGRQLVDHIHDLDVPATVFRLVIVIHVEAAFVQQLFLAARIADQDGIAPLVHVVVVVGEIDEGLDAMLAFAAHYRRIDDLEDDRIVQITIAKKRPEGVILGDCRGNAGNILGRFETIQGR